MGRPSQGVLLCKNFLRKLVDGVVKSIEVQEVAVESDGPSVLGELPMVNGLHQRYTRQAA
jgi:hypothetical protein